MSDKTIRVNEIFLSFQGEGLRTGHPSLFCRFFGCNFKCRGFGMLKGKLSDEADKIAERVIQYKSLDELPLTSTGCDSYPTWHKSFIHLVPSYDSFSLIAEFAKKLSTTNDQKKIDLVFTGGEPLLKNTQKFVVETIRQYKHYIEGFASITFETNTTQTLTKELSDVLVDLDIPVIFSCSPKLSCSGNPKEKAIIPQALKSYWDVVDRRNKLGKQAYCYGKFVVIDEDDIKEVKEITLYSSGKHYLDFRGNVYLMPEGGTIETYNNHARFVAEQCIKLGFIFCDRLHIRVFKNSWNT